MSDKNSDLPGFYKDPKTGKYFREAREGAVNPSLNKLKIERKEEAFENVNRVKTLNITNVSKLLRSRELGSIFGLPVEREYYKIQTLRKKDKMQVSLNDYQPDKIVSVEYIKGFQDSVLGVWNIKGYYQKYPCVIGRKTLCGLEERQPSEFELCRHVVIDICEGPGNSIIYVYFHKGTGYYNIHHRNDLTRHYCDSPIFCCESTERGEIFAFGCENYFAIFKDRFVTPAVEGTVHALSFDETSNVIMTGTNNGYLCLYDFRQRKQEMKMQVSKYCLSDMSFLNTHQVIVAGVNNLLITVDLRMKKAVTEFFGHVACSPKKRPFSFADNMLCVSGSDNISRIWHLSGGSPIDEMKPVGKLYNETRALLYGDSNKTYFYHFEKDMERMYECREIL